MKRLSLLILSCICLISASAQNNNLSYYAPIEMKFSDNWGKGYPHVSYVNTDFFEFIDTDNNRFEIYDIVRKINGTDLKDASWNDILILCASADTICYTTERAGEISNIRIRAVNNRFDWAKDASDNDERSLNRYRVLTEFPKALKIISDRDIDFSQYLTYDLLITGDDPLMDKKILKAFCESGLFKNLRRDEEKPDLIITLAKSSEESISSTYVPPTSQKVNTGSITVPMYSRYSGKTTYVTHQKYKQETTAGYTKTTTNTSMYLEISILDAKKMADPNQTYAPIIWQMIYDDFVTDEKKIDISDKFLSIVRNNTYPFENESVILAYNLTVGAAFDDEGKVIAVKPGTAAERLGLQPADQIIKVDGKKKVQFVRDFVTVDRSSFRLPSEIKLAISHSIVETTNAVNSKLFGIFKSPLYENSIFTVLRDGKEIELEGTLIPFNPNNRYIVDLEIGGYNPTATF